MLNCYYLGYNEYVFFSTLIEGKKGQNKIILRNIRERTINAYDEYLNTFSELQTKEESEFEIPDEKDALQHCYSSHTELFGRIRGEIFSRQTNVLQNWCPYCLLNRPSTLDHYIGQTEFPEYSVLVKNLIPCCNDCNKIKDEHWRQNNLRRYIHFYNDTFLDQRFLFASLDFNPANLVPRIEYNLVRPAHMRDEDFNIITWHFTDLDLRNQYAKRANTLVSSEIETIHNSIRRNQSLDVIRENLLIQYTSKIPDFGANFWFGIMYEALANSLEDIAQMGP